MKKTIFLSIMILLLVMCQDYLETNSDSTLGAQVGSEGEIAKPLTGAYPETSYFTFLEVRTGNMEERVNDIHSRLNEAMYYREDYDQEGLDTPLNHWDECYAGIAQANQTLELLGKYPKTDWVKVLYGGTFLLRTYLHFILIDIWAEPYGTAKSATTPGIPYLSRSEKNALMDYERGAIEEVYEEIEKNMKLGLSLVDDVYCIKPRFHLDREAAYAFASRFYLIKGEWGQVVSYSNHVLGIDPEPILRNWRKYKKEFDSNNKYLYIRYTSVDEPTNLLLTTTESRVARNIPSEKYGVTTQSTEKVYNQRGIDGCFNFREMKMQPYFLFNYNDGRIDDGQYIAKFDELSLSRYTGVHPRGLYVTNILFSTDEAMFSRMEAYAMLGEYNKAIDDLLVYLSIKCGMYPSYNRSAYAQTGSGNYQAYTPFCGVSINQLALIKIFLGFRRQEFLHESLRWFDIHRFYISVRHASKHKFYKQLKKENSRKLLQIPVETINRRLIPNPR